uniref:Uncharacterized protein n=1 Tax=Octopus bimaculoides TaxID=37653 RepID=A0A0L8H4G2_OCTBM
MFISTYREFLKLNILDYTSQSISKCCPLLVLWWIFPRFINPLYLWSFFTDAIIEVFILRIIELRRRNKITPSVIHIRRDTAAKNTTKSVCRCSVSCNITATSRSKFIRKDCTTAGKATHKTKPCTAKHKTVANNNYL